MCEPDDLEEFVVKEEYDRVGSRRRSGEDQEEEYDSGGSSTSSDLGAGEDETGDRRKRLDATLR